MNGAEALIQTAVAAGLEVCFANPGTTEMPLVAALDREPGMRGVLGLFEGVCTGAADGYARMSRRPSRSSGTIQSSKWLKTSRSGSVSSRLGDTTLTQV